MAGASWHQADYEALASLCAKTCVRLGDDEVIQTVEEFVASCRENSARTTNGNRNFDEDRFRAKVEKLLHG